MSAFNLAQVQQAQRVYLEGIWDAYQKTPDLWKQFEKMPRVDTNSKGRQITLETDPNPSLGFTGGNGQDLATTGSTNLQDLLVTYVWMNSGMEQTYMAMLNNNKETIDDPLAKYAKSSAEQFAQWQNIYASRGDGTTALATSSAAYNGGAPTVFVANGSTDTIGATQVAVGQMGWIYDSTGTTKRTAGNSNILEIATKSGTQFTVTATIPTSMIAGDIFVPENASGITTGPKGLPYIVADDNDYFNLDRATVEQVRSTVVSEGGSMSATGLFQIWAQVQQQGGRMDRKYASNGLKMVTNITQYGAYNALTVANTQNHLFMNTNAGAPKADIGADNLQFTWFNCPIEWYYQINGDAVYFLYMDLFKVAELKAAGPLKMPAGDWMKALTGSTSTYRTAEQRWMDAAYDVYSPQPFMLGVYNDLAIDGLPTQKGTY